MNAIIDIFKKNKDTFRNHETNEPINLFKINFFKFIFAFLFAFSFKNISVEFVNSLVAVYAILTGFSFNILFFLAQNKNFGEAESIEKKIDIKNLYRISKELFYNISYFNVLSLFSLIVFLYYYVRMPLPSISFINIEVMKCFVMFINFTYNLIIFTLIIECAYTFFRLIGRITYYFEKSLDC